MRPSSLKKSASLHSVQQKPMEENNNLPLFDSLDLAHPLAWTPNDIFLEPSLFVNMPFQHNDPPPLFFQADTPSDNSPFITPPSFSEGAGQACVLPQAHFSHGSPELPGQDSDEMADPDSDQIPLLSLFPSAPSSGGNFESDDLLDLEAPGQEDLHALLLAPSDPAPFGQDGEEPMEGWPEAAFDGFSGLFG